ncbi:MAG: PQQ-binding-like beta-propeller repeat protein [Deltaproteobacteria bacterium]|nr:PQQ-binding-like beta-propeller repeat protein [Deltaproteobacteria bacterium]
MKLIVVLFSLAAVSCTSPTHRAISTGNGPTSEVFRPKWEKKLIKNVRFSSVPEQFSSPVFNIPGNIIYTGTSEGNFYALNLNGQLVWKVNLASPIHSVPLLLSAKELVVVGTISGELFALSMKDGKTKWKFKGFGSFLGTLVYKNGVIYGTTSKNMLYAISAHDGKEHWSRRHETLGGFTVRGHSSPGLSGKNLIYGLSDGRVVNVDITKRGNILWIQSLENADDENYIDADSTPVIDGNTVYVATYRKGITALDLKTGKPVWRYGAYGVTDIHKVDEKLFFVSPTNGIHCITTSGKLVWRQNIKLGTPGKIIIEKRRMIIPFDKSGLIALDSKTGFFHQRFDTGDGVSGNAAYKNLLLAVLTNSGSLFLMDLR